MYKIILFLVLAINTACAQPSPAVPEIVDTYYRSFGSGQAILIINGGPGMSSEGFATIAQKIADLGYHTIIYDQRGTGRSALAVRDTSTITMDVMVEDIENLRKKLGITSWVVLGHSFGGLLATHYVARHPEVIEKIIFSSSGGVNLKFTRYVQERIQANLTLAQRDSITYYRETDLGEKERRHGRARSLAHAYVFDKTFAPAIAERLVTVDVEVNGLVFDNLHKIKYDYTGAFLDCPVPVLVLQGENDIISVETAREIAASFRHSGLVLLPSCGHYGWLDAHDVYMKAIHDFLKT